MRNKLCPLIPLLLLTMNALTLGQEEDPRRPFYIIGHMVNSIDEVREFIDRGSNTLESDISFHPDGKVRRIYHGPPCDCNRICDRTAPLHDYLDHLRNVSREPENFGKVALQFFDLKLSNVIRTDAKVTAGKDMADHVLDHLWKDIPDEEKMRVLVYVDRARDKDVIMGFREQFVSRGVENLLQRVGFDSGSDDSKTIEKMFQSIGNVSNVWQGDGTMNCFSAFYPDRRLKEEIRIRDYTDGYISKVYHWTIDDVSRMRRSLELGVDGMITNVPEVLATVLQDSKYSSMYRIATVDDEPFQKYSPFLITEF